MEQATTPEIAQNRDFRRYYDRYLQPLEREFEVARQWAVKERAMRGAAALVIWTAATTAFFWLAWPMDDAFGLSGAFVFFSALGLGFWAWQPTMAHDERLSNEIMTRIVPFFGGLDYRQKSRLSAKDFADWKLLPSYNKDQGEDQIQGAYRGQPLNLAEIRLEHQTGAGNNSKRVVAFEGLMIVVGLAHPAPGVTLIRTRGAKMKNRFQIDSALTPTSTHAGFEVFADDAALGDQPIATRQLDRLKRVVDTFGGGPLFASYHADCLVLLLTHKADYFELSSNQRTDFMRDAERTRQQLEKIFGLVDVMGRFPPGASVEPPGQPRLENSSAGESSDSAKDAGGWGCLTFFALFAVATCAGLWGMRGWMDQDGLIGLAALNGLILAAALSLVAADLKPPRIARLLIALALLGGSSALVWTIAPEEKRQQLWELFEPPCPHGDCA